MMNPRAPMIGFDRFIDREWAATALKIRAGEAGLGELEALLDQAALGAAARKKTRTVLNRLWLEPRAQLVSFADRGAELSRYKSAQVTAVLSWGMAIATYPFFGKVAEIIGRLSALQGDCASTEIHRRMSEIYGEREGTRRMTNMVMQTQAGWGAILRSNNGKRIIRQPAMKVGNEELIAWLIEAAVRYSDRPLSMTSLQSFPVLFPFRLDRSLSFVASLSPHLDIREEGSAIPIVTIRS